MFTILPFRLLRSVFLRHADTLRLRQLHVLSQYPDIFPPYFWDVILDKSLPVNLSYPSKGKRSSYGGYGQKTSTPTFTAISLLLTSINGKWRYIPPRPFGLRRLGTADMVVVTHYTRMLDSRGGYARAFRKRYQLGKEEGAARINGSWLEVRMESKDKVVSRGRNGTVQWACSKPRSEGLRSGNSKLRGLDWQPWFWLLD